MNAPANGKRPPAVFLAASIIIFVSALSAADSVGFVPCTFDGTCDFPVAARVELADLPQLGTPEPRASQGGGVLPDRIVSSKIGLDLPVQNPQTTDKDALEALLQQGPIRYADSAPLGISGNVFIFAHSSRLPVVKNQMFKAFNRISELKEGDTITLQGGGTSYLYGVVSLQSVDVNTAVDLSASAGKHLTLVTCDLARGKDWRWLVEAHLIGTA